MNAYDSIVPCPAREYLFDIGDHCHFLQYFSKNIENAGVKDHFAEHSPTLFIDCFFFLYI